MMGARPKKLCPACHTMRPVTQQDTFGVHRDTDGSQCSMSGEPATPVPPTPEERVDPLVGFVIGGTGYNAQFSHRRCQWKLSLDNVSLAELVDYAHLHLKRCPADVEN